MYRIAHAVVALVVVSFALAAPGPAIAQERSADVAAVRAVVASYVDARERRDATALAALFTDDADQLVSTGEWRRGRDAVVSGGLASSARTSGARTIEIETVRFVSPDVAVADGRYEIAAAAGAPARQHVDDVRDGQASRNLAHQRHPQHAADGVTRSHASDHGLRTPTRAQSSRLEPA